MKKLTIAVLSLAILISACSSKLETSTPTPSPMPVSVPQNNPFTAAACVVFRHDFIKQAIPIPSSVVVKNNARDGVLRYSLNGSRLERWKFNSLDQVSDFNVIRIAPDQDDSQTLIYIITDNSGIRIVADHGGEKTTLVSYPVGVMITRLISVPGTDLIVFSTLEQAPDGTSARSKVYISHYSSMGSTSPALVEDSNVARMTLPVAGHLDGKGNPDGVWLTYTWWGLEGDLMTETQAGLDYFDLNTKEKETILGDGCIFSTLSTSQKWATWFAKDSVNATDIQTGQTITIPFSNENNRGAHALISPSDGYLVWVEGTGLEYNNTLTTSLRIANLNGKILAEYPSTDLAKTVKIKEQISILPVGWMVKENEGLVVGISSVMAEKSFLLFLDINHQKIGEVAEGEFASFAYP